MAFYDSGYQVGAGYLPRIDPKNYALSGMERGLDMKRAVLGNNLLQQKTQMLQQQGERESALGRIAPQIAQGNRSALDQAFTLDPTGKGFEGALNYYGNQNKLKQEQQTQMEAKKKDFLARSAYDILNAPKEMQPRLHDEMIMKGIQAGILPPDAESEIGQFGEDDIYEMQRLVRGGLDFKDVATPKDNLTAMQKNIEASGYTPGTPEFQEAMRAAVMKPATEVNIGNEAETEGQKVLSKKSAENIIAAQDSGSLAQDVIFSANRLQQSIDSGAVGKLAEPKAYITEVMDSLGLEVSPADLQRATDVRAANRILGNKALDKLDTLKGSTSERDLSFGRNVAGRLSDGKGSVQEVADLMNASARKAQQIGELADSLIGQGLKPRDINIKLNEAKRNISLENIYNEIRNSRKKAKEDQQRQVDIELKQDPKVQEALKEGYSMEEIRKYLGK